MHPRPCLFRECVRVCAFVKFTNYLEVKVAYIFFNDCGYLKTEGTMYSKNISPVLIQKQISL